ncbi:MAG: RNA dependent RNA polymerase [Xiangshan rhabdo-like virus 4]|uniref:RNA-directed RNA polymerase L n=1 Tax=Xiangshan rhabdo-like virus 4 TaxID=2886227 RepID=A0A8K1YQQ3_9RHAB|nr:MAG: RNA dependent RNA polymerase [Xiangshan rhabdo-like virus 4]
MSCNIKMQVLGDFGEERNERSQPLLAIHLDAPVRDAKLKTLSDLLHSSSSNLRSASNRRLLKEFETIANEGHVSWGGLTFGFYPFFKSLGKSTTYNPNLLEHQSLSDLSNIIGLTQELVTRQIGMLPSQMSSLSKLPLIDRNVLLASKPLQYYWKLKSIFEDLTILTAAGAMKSTHLLPLMKGKLNNLGNGIFSTYLTKTMKLVAGRELTLIVDKTMKINWLGTREHLLMLSDVCCQRFMVILASELAFLNNMEHYPPTDILLKVFNWGDSILAIKGNMGYDLIGSWESLIIGHLLKISEDPYVNTETFYKTMREDFIVKGGTQDQVDSLYNLIQTAIGLSISNGFQLFGLYRIWGHPTIDSSKGILKLKKLACRPRPVNMQKINLIYEKFCEYFCMAYYRKNSSWPRCNISKLPQDSYLREKISKNLPIDAQHPNYKTLDWHFLTFQKTFIIPKQFDLSELISDKAMSHTFSVLADCIKKSRNIGNAADRSVIIQWMMSEIGDPEVFLEDIDSNGFGGDETVVGVCPKERELKIIARLFGLLTFKKRMYVVLTESLIATHFLKYFPEITVMNNQAELLKKQLFATQGMAESQKPKKTAIKIVVNIDFNKWNTNMRFVETSKIFKAMDNLLGYNKLIQRTHEMFTDSILYLADGTICPDLMGSRLKPSPYVWRGHLGGIEGLRQKGWTLWTVIILKYIMQICNINAQLMGQGDNQVLICSYPASLSTEEIISTHKKFLATLEDFISDLGPPLKREETWESTSLFMYGKFPIYKGCPQPLSMKKLSRYMRSSNVGFPTVDSSLSSLSAGFFDASWMDFSLIIPCICYTFEVINSLKLHLEMSVLSLNPLIELVKRRSSFKIPDQMGGQTEVKLPRTAWGLLDNNYKILWSLFLLPRSLGGYPITWLPQVLLRGFPDPLTLDISCLLNIRRNQDKYPLLDWQQQIIDNILHPYFNSSKSYDMLGEDPLSVNLLHPSSPGDQLKRLVFDLLLSPGLKKSSRFLNFLEKVKPNQSELASFLSQMTPKVNPKIMHEIMSATVTSRAMQVIQRINKTNTLTHLMIKNHDRDLSKRIHISELNYLTSVIFQVTTNLNSHNFTCSTEIANYMRTTSWELPITGVTIASPLEAFDLHPWNDTECPENHPFREDGYILLKQFNEYSLPINKFLGPSIPYIGSETVQKVKGYGQTVTKTAAPILTRISKLLSLIGWGTDRTSNMSNVLKALLASITDISPDLFEAKFGEVSGSVEHRFHDSLTHKGCFLPILYNGSSWLSLSTSTLTKYAKGSKNVNLHFQAVMILLESWYSLIHAPYESPGYHLHINCQRCIQPISEELLDLPPLPTDFSLFPSYPNDPYFWVSKEEIELSDELHYFPQQELQVSTSVDDSHAIFHEISARYVAENFRKFVEETSTSSVSIHESKQLSVAWIFKLDVPLFLSFLIRYLFDYYIYHNIFSIQTLDPHLNGFYNFIISISPSWFSLFYPLTLERDIIINLVRAGLLIPPPGVPPSLSQWCLGFKTMLLTVIQKQGIPQLYIKFATPSRFPEFYPCWNHLVTGCLINQITFYQLREAKKWLPIEIMYQSSGTVSVESLFRLNPFNKNSPRYWKSWTQLENILNLHTWYVTYSIPDFWKQFIPDTFKVKVNPRPFPIIKGLPNLSKPLLVLKQDKKSMGFQTISLTPISLKYEKIDIGYTNFLKPLSKSTTSPYKAFSILDGLLNGLIFYPKILVVGDGAGGFSLVSQMLSPQSDITYNSKITPEYIGPQGLPGYYPSDFYYYDHIAHNIKGVGMSLMGISDISNRKWVDQMDFLHSDVVICDAEFSYEDSAVTYSALMNLLLYCQVKEVSLFIFKSYFNQITLFSIICETIHHYFESLSIQRSEYSNENGSEVYIIAKKLRSLCVLTDLKIQRDTWVFSGATSKTSIQHIIDTFSKIQLPLSVNIPSNKISEYLECPEDRSETYTLLSRFGVMLEGHYPSNLYTAWKHRIDLGSLEEWKVKKKFIINKLKANFLKTLIAQHLFYLGLLITNQTSFRGWVRIYNTGFIYLWLSKDHSWRSGVSFKRDPSGQGYCRFRINKYIPKTILHQLVKVLSRVHYFRLSKTRPQVTLHYPTPLPPLSGKYSRKHSGGARLRLPELPASKRLCLTLFGYKHEAVPESFINTSSRLNHQLLNID